MAALLHGTAQGSLILCFVLSFSFLVTHCCLGQVPTYLLRYLIAPSWDARENHMIESSPVT
jgi:hypothetical protein